MKDEIEKSLKSQAEMLEKILRNQTKDTKSKLATQITSKLNKFIN